ncbi:MAG: SDR family oxidoreductase [Terriglobales bacterium]
MPELNLVTGGAGFIGSHLVRALLAQGQRVRVLDNFSTGHPDNLAGLTDVDVLEGSICVPQDCAQACRGVTRVFHEAAIPSVARSVEEPLESHEAGATGTLNMLLAARAAGVQRFIYASSSSVYGRNPVLPKHEEMCIAPVSPYAVAKLAGEQYCRAFFASYGLETVALRYFNVFGPRQRPDSSYSGVLAIFLGRLYRGEGCSIFGDGTQSRDFTYVDNVVAANLLAASSAAAPGGIYNVGCGERVTLQQAYALIARELGSDLTPSFGPPRAGDVPHSLADIRAAQRDLGYEPRTDLSAGIHLTVEWYRQLMEAVPVGLQRS